MVWSSPRQVALAVLPKFSSLFSLFGSLWIVTEVCTSPAKRSHPYHRMLLAMSFYDIAESVGNFMSTWPIPEGSGDDKKWAIGNQATCSVQGFFLTTSVAVPIYNAFLALFYVLVVNYNVSDRSLRRLVEPAIHAIAFVWAFGTAIASAVLGLFNDANLWCWIAPYPSGCLDTARHGAEGNCERGDNAWIYRWIFYFVPLWICILLASLCTALVYRRVKALDERTLRYRRPETVLHSASGRSSVRRGSLTGHLWHSPAQSQDSEPTSSVRRGSLTGRLWQSPSPSQDLEPTGSPGSESNNGQLADAGSGTLGEGPTRSRRPSLLSFTSRRRIFDLATEELRDDMFLSGSSEIANIQAVSVFQQWRENREIYREDYARSVEVAHQSLFYLVSFYLTHVWSTANRTMQQLNLGKTSFGLILVHSWFDPFQGFLNFLVYQRPRYLKIRNANPGYSRARAISTALRFSFRPDENQTSSGDSEPASRFSSSKTSSRCKRSDRSTPGSFERSDPFRCAEKTSVTDQDDPHVLSTIPEDSLRDSFPTIELIQDGRFSEAQARFETELKLRLSVFEDDRVDL